MAITVLGASGKSYCGEQSLHLMGADGETFLFPLGKKGPVNTAAVTLELTKSVSVPSCETFPSASSTRQRPTTPWSVRRSSRTSLSSAKLSGRSPWRASRL